MSSNILLSRLLNTYVRLKISPVPPETDELFTEIPIGLSPARTSQLIVRVSGISFFRFGLMKSLMIIRNIETCLAQDSHE